MKKLNKRLKQSVSVIEKGKVYSVEDAVTILKKLPQPKFDQTVDLACNLNIDPKQTEQAVRGAIILPHGVGKKVTVCVFCKGEDAHKAKEAGADFIGDQELAEKIQKGWLGFDKVAATPEMMREIAALGKVLGPRGLMPSPKAGTVGPDIANIVKELKSGKVQFKSDKTGNVHSVAGKISFSETALSENIHTVLRAIINSRPSMVKGKFIKSLSISTTMGPSLKLDAARIK